MGKWVRPTFNRFEKEKMGKLTESTMLDIIDQYAKEIDILAEMAADTGGEIRLSDVGGMRERHLEHFADRFVFHYELRDFVERLK